MKKLNFLLVFVFSAVQGNYFIWDSYVKFDDANRWNKNVTRPCLDSKVSFKQDERSSVLISKDFTISDFTIPSDFELIIDDGVTIGVDLKISNCQDESDYIFDAGPDSWYDLSKWKIYDKDPSRGGGNLIDFCLDTELIPCQYDNVEFQALHTFGVSTEINPIANLTYNGPAATVFDFKFWDKLINRVNLYDNLISTTTAKYNFGDSEFLFGTADGSCDESGCLCREDNYNGKVEVEEIICNQIDCSTRSFIDCREPVNPFGHCCPICGGIITLDFDSKFIFNDMKDFVDDNIRIDYPSNQLFYTINRIPRTEENYDPANLFSNRKSGPDQIQLLVVDTDGTGKEAKIEVGKLKKGISKIPGVSNVKVTTSGRPNVGSGAFSGGEIFGILFGVTVALVIANFAYKKYDLGYYLPQLPGRSTMAMSSYMSNSNDADSGNGGLEEVKIPTIQDRSQDTEQTYDEYNSDYLNQEPVNTGLVNPTFEEDDESSNVEGYGDQTTVIVGEQNPLFDDTLTASPSITSAPETSPKTETTKNNILFDMNTPEVSNEQTLEEDQTDDISTILPKNITGIAPIEIVSSEKTVEISKTPIEPDLPELTVSTTDSLDIISAGVQNKETNKNEESQPNQTIDDLGFLDVFG